MKKFEKVKRALEEKTRYTGNFITVTKNIDARHRGKYAILNIVTNRISSNSYRTLNEIIKKFDLKI